MCRPLRGQASLPQGIASVSAYALTSGNTPIPKTTAYGSGNALTSGYTPTVKTTASGSGNALTSGNTQSPRQPRLVQAMRSPVGTPNHQDNRISFRQCAHQCDNPITKPTASRSGDALTCGSEACPRKRHPHLRRPSRVAHLLWQIFFTYCQESLTECSLLFVCIYTSREGVRKICRPPVDFTSYNALARLSQRRWKGVMRRMPAVQVHNNKEAQ